LERALQVPEQSFVSRTGLWVSSINRATRLDEFSPTYWATVYFGQWLKNYRSGEYFWTAFFHGSSLAKNIYIGRLFRKHIYLITLSIKEEERLIVDDNTIASVFFSRSLMRTNYKCENVSLMGQCDQIGRCYDHNFLRFCQFSAKKMAFFLKNQCYDPIFA
jgi:hypothetical protein